MRRGRFASASCERQGAAENDRERPRTSPRTGSVAASGGPGATPGVGGATGNASRPHPNDGRGSTGHPRPREPFMSSINRSLVARAAAHTRWARTADRTAATAPARAAFEARFEHEVDPERVLPTGSACVAPPTPARPTSPASRWPPPNGAGQIEGHPPCRCSDVCPHRHPHAAGAENRGTAPPGSNGGRPRRLHTTSSGVPRADHPIRTLVSSGAVACWWSGPPVRRRTHSAPGLLTTSRFTILSCEA